jgi:hypothetical protein
VRHERALVEWEVRRRDHGDGGRAGLGGVCGERNGLGGRLRPAVDGDGESARGRGEEELRRAAPLHGREQDSLARRPEREDPVDPARGEELRIRREGALVERGAAVAKRCQRGRERSPDHGRSIGSRGPAGR